MNGSARRFASVLLVDPRGWVLLQERDEHARISPDCWGLVGGHVEPGEAVERAAHRELGEETGLAVGHDGLTGPLRLWRDFTAHEDGATIWVFTGATRATDADVVCGEGRQIVFVEPSAAVTLPLSDVAAVVVPLFLDSPEYASLLP
ncbi:NUDIX hydrolase [Nocardioides sp.]|uniref:NUDIX domain-containing protein n=1 Tax=Nocardioides sp. TaxID=35761 RepID=UPI001A308B10|nr:NUDIX hydrolase [Nocardioides sp.]MBJ7359686.1 NUDIX domain-containing protein [Nocardioides sp.]